jgi:hypothetical protein
MSKITFHFISNSFEVGDPTFHFISKSNFSNAMQPQLVPTLVPSAYKEYKERERARDLLVASPRPLANNDHPSVLPFEMYALESGEPPSRTLNWKSWDGLETLKDCWSQWRRSSGLK